MNPSRSALILFAVGFLSAEETGQPAPPPAEAKQEEEKPPLMSLRLGYEQYDDRYDLRVAGASGDHHWSDDQAWFFGYYTKIPLVQLGLVGTYRESKDDVASTSLDYRRLGGRLEAGLSVPLLPRLLYIDLMPFLGFEEGRLEYDTLLGNDTDSSWGWNYGIHADAVGTVGPVMLGLGIGYAWSEQSFDEDIAGSTIEIRVKENVALARVFLGWRF